MKFYTLFFALIFFFFSCKKEEVHPFVFGEWGEASAQRTGNLVSSAPQWNAETKTFPLETNFCDNCFSITFNLLDRNGFLSEKVSFRSVPVSEGKYNSTIEILQEESTAQTSFSTWEGDDVVTGRYIIFEENENNFIEITSIEEKRSEIRIKGRFQGTYIRREAWLVNNIPPDTIYIKSGEFEGRLPK